MDIISNRVCTSVTKLLVLTILVFTFNTLKTTAFLLAYYYTWYIFGGPLYIYKK